MRDMRMELQGYRFTVFSSEFSEFRDRLATGIRSRVAMEGIIIRLS